MTLYNHYTKYTTYLKQELAIKKLSRLIKCLHSQARKNKISKISNIPVFSPINTLRGGREQLDEMRMPKCADWQLESSNDLSLVHCCPLLGKTFNCCKKRALH